jgi:hypothetical protein
MPVEVGIDERNAERGKNQRREAKSEEKDYGEKRTDKTETFSICWKVRN